MTADVEDLLRELAPQVLGMVARRYGDFDSAEDAVQEALAQAALRWPSDGLPANPRAWLAQAAGHRLVDQWRSDRSRRQREILTARQEPAASNIPDQDDTLVVLFLCCHPVLSPASAIALTLRAVGGLTTEEIAHAFLVPEATMAQRISRAKQRIRSSGEPFRMPSRPEWSVRLRSVLHVLYLIYNEGYTTSGGAALHRVELSHEAIRLTRMLHEVLPADPEVTGLLALMLLTDARRPARIGADGTPVALPDQDRSRWDAALVDEGLKLLDSALANGAAGEYQLQAAIAAIHDRAGSPEDTDWPQIHALYGLLERMTGNPVVTLNRAVAAAMADGPEAGLAVLDEVADRLAGNHRVDAVRGHLLELAGDLTGAAASYTAAGRRTTSVPEQRYLARQAARLNATLAQKG